MVVYGALGQYTCLYYNVYVSSTITTQGQSCISAAGLFFESFLNNNVHFASLNEVIQFIDNVCQEKNERQFQDRDWLDRDITIGECFYKLMTTCGFDFVFVEDETSDGSKIEGFNKYIPSQEDLEIVWDILCDLPQEDINRLFYKNNLFGFMENPALTKCIALLLSTLNVPFLDPNKPPKEIQEELDFYAKEEEKLVETYADGIDEKGKVIFSDEQKKKMFFNEIEKLQNTNIDLDFSKIDISLADIQNIKLTPSDFYLLENIINFIDIDGKEDRDGIE